MGHGELNNQENLRDLGRNNEIIDVYIIISSSYNNLIYIYIYK